MSETDRSPKNTWWYVICYRKNGPQKTRADKFSSAQMMSTSLPSEWKRIKKDKYKLELIVGPFYGEHAQEVAPVFSLNRGVENKLSTLIGLCAVGKSYMRHAKIFDIRKKQLE